MPRLARYPGQVLLYALFFVPLAYLTSAPAYQPQAPEMATLKLALRHAGKTVGECTPVTGAAYDKMPANMRRPEICPRERSPLRVRLLLDDTVLYSETIQASGLHRDGLTSIYKRFTIPAGHYRISLLMNDDVAEDVYTWQLQQQVELVPAQVMVISFKEGFRIQ